jgi:hypothetical protein
MPLLKKNPHGQAKPENGKANMLERTNSEYRPGQGNLVGSSGKQGKI